MMRAKWLMLAMAALIVAADRADAAVINPAFTQTSSNGNHNDFPGTRAVVSDWFGEDHRGITEFNIGSVGAFSSATLSFLDFSEGGAGLNIDVVAYHGDGSYSLSGDWGVAPFATVGSLSQNAINPGDTLSFDVTSALQSAIANGDSFLGIRLQRTNDPSGVSFVDFRNFQLNVADQVVPEPTSLALLGLGGIGLAGRAIRKRRLNKTAA